MTTQMAREIAEQPEAVARTLDALRPLRGELARLAAGTRHILFVARGSSDNACVYGRYLVETHAHRMAGLAAPSVATHYHAEVDLTDALVVCVSQSGETREIVETQEWAASRGARTVAVTNDGASALARGADLTLATDAGRELAVPATKTYTTQLAAMAVLATALAPEPTALDADLARAPKEMARLVEQREGVDAAAAQLAHSEETLVSGRGLLFGTALEVALKLEETCLRPVRGLSYADLRHGPIAVVDSDVVAIVVAAQDGPVVGGLTEVALDLQARGATTIGLGGDSAFAQACSLAVPGPDLPELVAPLAAVVPGQLTVEALARTLGLDPDSPRGLSKVTQTDAG
ncbi:SIS domain-containing protein [Actinopolymorpha pittospori]|uniref:Glucosamine--fructose-6-phosphate aminotransferase (Isomerizing) n=1 Tax=Actinopolymorpha pittospori TaxID=648752 RepID=A0A927RDS3_9ACTN|nr:SIS domain-containing protein [Actinopolymorpha pittospori]MBE1612737.1 glucosamine--fructose-6-phosphate aminotransferase (isomerizing) [Actinopolymorpha pittospori]